MDALDFYQHHFQLVNNGQPLPAVGFNKEPRLFIDKYLKLFGKALATLVNNEDEELVAKQDGAASNQLLAQLRWCRQVIFNLLCFPTQLWHTAAVLAISMAQASKTSAAWLRSFLGELECLTLGAMFLCTSKQQKAAFTQLIRNLQQVIRHFCTQVPQCHHRLVFHLDCSAY